MGPSFSPGLVARGRYMKCESSEFDQERDSGDAVFGSSGNHFTFATTDLGSTISLYAKTNETSVLGLRTKYESTGGFLLCIFTLSSFCRISVGADS